MKKQLAEAKQRLSSGQHKTEKDKFVSSLTKDLPTEDSGIHDKQDTGIKDHVEKHIQARCGGRMKEPAVPNGLFEGLFRRGRQRAKKRLRRR